MANGAAAGSEPRPGSPPTTPARSKSRNVVPRTSGPTAPARRDSVPRPSQLIGRQPARDPSSTQSLGPAVRRCRGRLTWPSTPRCRRGRSSRPRSAAPGSLQPAVVVGIGTVGDRVVRYLRRAVGEQFGGPDAVPHLRLLSIDTDPEATAGNRDALLTRLFRPSHYLNKFRDGGGLDWVPPGFALPAAAQPVYHRTAGPGPAGVLGPREGDRATADGRVEAALAPAALFGRRPPHAAGREDESPAGLCRRHAGRRHRRRHVSRRGVPGPAPPAEVRLYAPGRRRRSHAAADRPRRHATGGLANTYAALAELAHFSRSDTNYEARSAPGTRSCTTRSGRSAAACACRYRPAPTRQRGGWRPARPRVCCSAICSRRSAGPPTTPARPRRTILSHRGLVPAVVAGRRLARRAAAHLATACCGNGRPRTSTPFAPPSAPGSTSSGSPPARPGTIDRPLLTSAAEAAAGGPPDARFDAIVDGLAKQVAAGPKIDGKAACVVFNDVVGSGWQADFRLRGGAGQASCRRRSRPPHTA